MADENPTPPGGGFDPGVIVTDLPSDPQQPSQAAPLPGQGPEDLAESQPGDERQPAGDEQGPSPFPDEHKQGFQALLTVGRLTDTFYWLGVEFVIRTLTDGELMDVGLIHKKYAGTLGDIKAYQTAIAAACLVTVDGEVPPIPLETQPKGDLDVEPVIVARFNYARRNWYPPTIDAIYERYLLLEKQANEVVDAMGNRSG